MSSPETLDAAAAAAAGRFAERAARTGEARTAYAELDSPLGPLVAAVTERGLVRLAYADGGAGAVLDDLAARLGPRIVRAPGRVDATARELEEYFAGRRRRFDLRVDWALTRGFARRLLEATAGIGFGSTVGYADVAAAAGSPRGARAAGNALSANPIPIVVPCHRVLRTGGALGGYTGGLHRKRFLLDLEAGRSSWPT